MVNYYPPEIRVSSLARQYPELELVDEDEEQRLQDVEDKKRRGKGPPKKAKTKGACILRQFRLRGLVNVIFFLQPTADGLKESGSPFLRTFFVISRRLGMSYFSTFVNSEPGRQSQ